MLPGTIKRRIDKLMFSWFFECHYCAYDVRNEIPRCPKCNSFALRWIKVLNMGMRRVA